MCYYSASLSRRQFRDNVVGEDLTISQLDYNHTVVRSNKDGMIVCVSNRTEVHIEAFELNPDVRSMALNYWPQLNRFIGKPVSGRFRQTASDYAADALVIEGIGVPLGYFAKGMKMYTGPERKPVPVETRLGMDDPSIVYDHRTDNAPTFMSTAKRVLGLCSIKS